MSEYVARNAALDAVAIGNADWTNWALIALYDAATEQPDLTSDDVWRVLRRHGIPDPTEPRAMGPVMLTGAKRGWISATDRVRSSEDPASPNHARPQRIYASQLTGAEPAHWPERPDLGQFRCRCGAYSMKPLVATLSPRVRMGYCHDHGLTMFTRGIDQ